MGKVVVIFGLWLATLINAATASSRIYNMLDDNMHAAAAGNHIYNVLDYGAHGNGRDDDIQAFLKAWSEACADPTRSTFLVPSGSGITFLLSKIMFMGPCKSEIHVQISGNIVAQPTRWTNILDTWIMFKNVYNLTVDGSGHIDGQGAIWWPCISSRSCSLGPYTLQFIDCNGLDLSGIYLHNSPGKHVVVHQSKWVKIHGLTITAPGDSPNTDGILISESEHVNISSSTIGVGDDCIAMLSGSYDVDISSITCGPGHGISIGSLGANSAVEKIRVSDSKIFNTSPGVRIKTKQGGSGYVRDVTYERITFTSVRDPILIDQFYCPHATCSNISSAVAISDVTYNNLHGTSVNPVAITLACSQVVKCNNIVLNNVSLTTEGTGATAQANCNNANGRMMGTVSPQVSCLN